MDTNTMIVWIVGELALVTIAKFFLEAFRLENERLNKGDSQ